jgi:hypothetical protein
VFHRHHLFDPYIPPWYSASADTVAAVLDAMLALAALVIRSTSSVGDRMAKVKARRRGLVVVLAAFQVIVVVS